MKLWIDDFRPPPDGSWCWCTTSQEAIPYIPYATEISFDYDLGEDDNTYGIALSIEYRAVNGIKPPKWFIHSQNPVGREKLGNTLQNADMIYYDL